MQAQTELEDTIKGRHEAQRTLLQLQEEYGELEEAYERLRSATGAAGSQGRGGWGGIMSDEVGMVADRVAKTLKDSKQVQTDFEAEKTSSFLEICDDASEAVFLVDRQRSTQDGVTQTSIPSVAEASEGPEGESSWDEDPELMEATVRAIATIKTINSDEFRVFPIVGRAVTAGVAVTQQQQGNTTVSEAVVAALNNKDKKKHGTAGASFDNSSSSFTDSDVESDRGEVFDSLNYVKIGWCHQEMEVRSSVGGGIGGMGMMMNSMDAISKGKRIDVSSTPAEVMNALVNILLEEHQRYLHTTASIDAAEQAIFSSDLRAHGLFRSDNEEAKNLSHAIAELKEERDALLDDQRETGGKLNLLLPQIEIDKVVSQQALSHAECEVQQLKEEKDNLKLQQEEEQKASEEKLRTAIEDLRQRLELVHNDQLEEVRVAVEANAEAQIAAVKAKLAELEKAFIQEQELHQQEQRRQRTMMMVDEVSQTDITEGWLKMRLNEEPKYEELVSRLNTLQTAMDAESWSVVGGKGGVGDDRALIIEDGMQEPSEYFPTLSYNGPITVGGIDGGCDHSGDILSTNKSQSNQKADSSALEQVTSSIAEYISRMHGNLTSLPDEPLAAADENGLIRPSQVGVPSQSQLSRYSSSDAYSSSLSFSCSLAGVANSFGDGGGGISNSMAKQQIDIAQRALSSLTCEHEVLLSCYDRCVALLRMVGVIFDPYQVIQTARREGALGKISPMASVGSSAGVAKGPGGNSMPNPYLRNMLLAGGGGGGACNVALSSPGLSFADTRSAEDGRSEKRHIEEVLEGPHVDAESHKDAVSSDFIVSAHSVSRSQFVLTATGGTMYNDKNVQDDICSLSRNAPDEVSHIRESESDHFSLSNTVSSVCCPQTLWINHALDILNKIVPALHISTEEAGGGGHGSPYCAGSDGPVVVHSLELVAHNGARGLGWEESGDGIRTSLPLDNDVEKECSLFEESSKGTRRFVVTIAPEGKSVMPWTSAAKEAKVNETEGEIENGSERDTVQKHTGKVFEGTEKIEGEAGWTVKQLFEAEKKVSVLLKEKRQLIADLNLALDALEESKVKKMNAMRGRLPDED